MLVVWGSTPRHCTDAWLELKRPVVGQGSSGVTSPPQMLPRREQLFTLKRSNFEQTLYRRLRRVI